MSDGQILKPGQTLMETWTIEYEGTPYPHRDGKRIKGRLHTWPHTTYYMSTQHGETVDEVRLDVALALARGIVDDASAFKHDTRDINMRDTLSWLESVETEVKEELEEYVQTPATTFPLDINKGVMLGAKLNFLADMIARFKEDNDFYPEEAEADGS